MNLPDIDWHYLGRHTFLPAISLVVACLIFAGSIWIYKGQQKLHVQFSTNQDAIYQDYDDLLYRRRLIDRYYRRYEQFHELGFIGRERRLDWVDTMRRTTLALDLPHVNYSVEPQLPIAAPVPSALSGADVQIHASRITLEMGLVHELDLLRFFDSLQAEAPGLIKVDRCALVRQSQSGATMGIDANIVANCSLMIFSVVTSDVTLPVAQL